MSRQNTPCKFTKQCPLFYLILFTIVSSEERSLCPATWMFTADVMVSFKFCWSTTRYTSIILHFSFHMPQNVINNKNRKIEDIDYLLKNVKRTRQVYGFRFKAISNQHC